MENIKNLVFSGSGSKIFMHIGFVRYLVENNLFKNVDTFIGTSGGAIVALLLSVNYDIDTLTELFIKLKYEQLEKIDSDSILNFFETYGIDSGENMERALRIMIKNKIGKSYITFKELYEETSNNLVICATNLQRHQEVYFDRNNYPDCDVIEASLMSMAIPLLYTPRNYKDELYVDGGLLNHYPIEYIETCSLNRDETLGILILPDYNMCNSSGESGVNSKIDIPTFESYILNILGCSSIQKLKCTFDEYKNHTVLVVNNNNGLNFNVTKELKKQYMIEAYECTKQFLINRKTKEIIDIVEEPNESNSNTQEVITSDFSEDEVKDNENENDLEDDKNKDENSKSQKSQENNEGTNSNSDLNDDLNNEVKDLNDNI